MPSVGESCRRHDKWGVCHELERPRAVYQVARVDTDSKPTVASEDSDVLGLLMRHLLPTPAVSPPKATPILSDRDLLIQRLLGTVHPLQPVVQECSGIADIDVLLQSMLPVGSVAEDYVRPPADRQEPTAGWFFFGAESQSMRLRGVLLWMSRFLSCHRGGSDGQYICIATAPEGGHLSSSGKRRLIRGGGLVTRISDNYEPQFPVVSKDLPCPAARDVVASRVEAVQPLETVTQRSRVIRNSFHLPCSDLEESDDDVLSVGAVWPLMTAAPLGGAGMLHDCQQRADSNDDVFSMGARVPMDRPGMLCVVGRF